MTTYLRLTVTSYRPEAGSEMEPAGYPCAFNFRLVDRYFAVEPDEDDEVKPRACVIVDGVEYYVAESVADIDALLNASQLSEVVVALSGDDA